MTVYAIRCGTAGPVKIGRADDPWHRLMELQVAHYETLHLIRVWEGGEAEETSLHDRFADLRIRGEWFSFSRLMLGDVGLVEIAADRTAEPRPIVAPAPDAAPADVIGYNIRLLRRAKGLTQQDAAAALGTARSTLAGIEAGHYGPGRELLLAIARLFETTAETICSAPDAAA